MLQIIPDAAQPKDFGSISFTCHADSNNSGSEVATVFMFSILVIVSAVQLIERKKREHKDVYSRCFWFQLDPREGTRTPMTQWRLLLTFVGMSMSV